MSSNKFIFDKSLEEYVGRVKTKSEDIIKDVFPRKIEELENLLESDDYNFDIQQPLINEAVILPVPDPDSIITSFSDLQVSKGIKKENGQHSAKEKFAGQFPCNPVISKHFLTLKPFIRDLVEHSNLLKLWITFLIPKIEDGNNFGVSIQEGILTEITEAESWSASAKDGFNAHRINRGKIISKVIKYPAIEDYWKVISELDEKAFLNIRYILEELRDQYAGLYVLIARNWDKINTPRSSNAESMY